MVHNIANQRGRWENIVVVGGVDLQNSHFGNGWGRLAPLSTLSMFSIWYILQAEPNVHRDRVTYFGVRGSAAFGSHQGRFRRLQCIFIGLGRQGSSNGNSTVARRASSRDLNMIAERFIPFHVAAKLLVSLGIGLPCRL